MFINEYDHACLFGVSKGIRFQGVRQHLAASFHQPRVPTAGHVTGFLGMSLELLYVHDDTSIRQNNIYLYIRQLNLYLFFFFFVSFANQITQEECRKIPYTYSNSLYCMYLLVSYKIVEYFWYSSCRIYFKYHHSIYHVSHYHFRAKFASQPVNYRT